MSTKPISNNLTDAIDALFLEMTTVNADSPEYAQMADQLVKLYHLKEVDTTVASKKSITPDTALLVAGNLVGIFAIVGHEKANVVTSKALSLLMKLR